MAQPRQVFADLLHRSLVGSIGALAARKAVDDGRGPYSGTRPVDVEALQECFRDGAFGTSALVLDAYGMWHWWRRDFHSIRDLVELGVDDGLIYEKRE